MSEISTTFTANTAAFSSDLQKAQAGVRKFSEVDLPLMESSLNRGFLATQKTAAGFNAMGAAGKKSGTNLLVLAQVADDAQYGFRGLANQIPQLAMALGAGAGLAGAVSLAALGLFVLVPLVQKAIASFTGQTVIDRERDALIAYAQATNQAGIELKKFNATRRDAQTEKTNTAITNERADNPKRIVDQTNDSLQRQKALTEELRRQEDALIAARKRAFSASLDAGNFTGEQRTTAEGGVARAEGSLSVQRLEEDRKANIDSARKAASAVKQIDEEVKSAAQSIATQTAAASAAIEKLFRKLDENKARQAGAQSKIDATAADKSDTAKEQNRLAKQELQNLQNQSQELNRALELQKNRLQQQDNLAESVDKSAKAAKDAINNQITKLREEKDLIDAKIANQKKINELTDQENAANAQKIAQQEASAALQKIAAEPKKEEALKSSQKVAIADIKNEVAALRLEAGGNKAGADELRDQAAQQKEIAALAIAAGVTERQATAIIREKHELEKAITREKENQKKHTERTGRIRLFARGENPNSPFASPRAGLERSVIERNVAIANAKKPVRQDVKIIGGDPAQTELLDVTREILKLWKNNLGLV